METVKGYRAVFSRGLWVLFAMLVASWIVGLICEAAGIRNMFSPHLGKLFIAAVGTFVAAVQCEA